MVVQVIGVCSGVCHDNTLSIDIANIVLNVPTAYTAAVSAANAVHEGSSIKKKKSLLLRPH
jgi:hypothetical protein